MKIQPNRYYWTKFARQSVGHSNLASTRVLIRYAILVPLLISLHTSCEKILEIGAPTTSTNTDNVYSSDLTAIAVLTGIYSNMSLVTFEPNQLYDW